jgi:hypothetical protein
LFGLRWADVDFESAQVLIRETKTGVQRRVPLSRRARWLVAKLAARAPLSTWVFESASRDGSPAPVSDVKKAWRQALRRARIEDFQFHDLRHTFASHVPASRSSKYFGLQASSPDNWHMFDQAVSKAELEDRKSSFSCFRASTKSLFEAAFNASLHFGYR